MVEGFAVILRINDRAQSSLPCPDMDVISVVLLFLVDFCVFISVSEDLLLMLISSLAVCSWHCNHLCVFLFFIDYYVLLQQKGIRVSHSGDREYSHRVWETPSSKT